MAFAISILALGVGSASARAAAPPLLSGRAARTRLGPALGAVARRHGLTRAGLERLLRTDPTVHTDAKGDLLFLDRGERGPSMVRDSVVYDSAAPFPLDQTFALHTDPGADRILYLDFDGGTYTPGPPPKTQIPEVPTVTIPPFGGTTPFNDETLAKIQSIWQRVAEDYAPFHLDVTTQEPTEADLENCADTCGAKVSIGGEPASAGLQDAIEGAAPLGVSFGVDTMPTAFVFTAGPFTTDELQAANTISHEAGHTFGLLHDGLQPHLPEEGYYYNGFGDWCPIMGSCVLPLTQWSKGEYPGANNQEDDLAKIAAIAPERADDFPGSAPLGGAPDAVEQHGLIGTRDDTDTFTFESGGGPATFTVQGAAPQPNLDAGLTLLDDEGAVVAAADDPDGLDATLTRTLSSGRYSLRVDGVGDSDPLPGYSDYGSLGRYSITGSYTPVPRQPEVITTPMPTPRPPSTSGPAAGPDPTLSGRAKGKFTTVRVSCGDRPCLVQVRSTIVSKRGRLGELRALKKHLPADATATLKLKTGRRLLAKMAGKHDAKEKIRAVFSYADGTHINRVRVLRVR